jgi:hypothetical protein
MIHVLKQEESSNQNRSGYELPPPPNDDYALGPSPSIIGMDEIMIDAVGPSFVPTSKFHFGIDNMNKLISQM